MPLWRHRRLRRLVHAYLDRELQGPPARRAAHHLRTCFDCSADADTLRLVRFSLQRSTAATVNALAGSRLDRFARDLVRGR